MLGLSQSVSALVLLILITPVCAWVVYTDLKFMKIRNKATLTLLLIFAVAGPFVMPLDIYAWRWVNAIAIFVLGYILNQIANFGAGDAKFAAAAAPFFSTLNSHVMLTVMLLAAFLLGAFAAHRLARAIPAVRNMAPDWVSWHRKDFPMGLALVGTLWAYLLIVALN
ncbi:membrane protein [Thioclava dalianensis]|uniref:Membrane protein n=1 Tax=Thioclava dalianensis TaxID=1185766 RepID=A0A074TDP2_9RHOB|nr:prepilin peptidase [Thioclava dalianensis]KEP68255.1 membrane protein [Thioclava dalianensis]SFM90009.1 prepilin peptidase CpaA [Thioclava dalianensis]